LAVLQQLLSAAVWGGQNLLLAEQTEFTVELDSCWRDRKNLRQSSKAVREAQKLV